MIFISHRTTDAPHLVGWLHDSLTREFNSDAVFWDKEGLQGGEHWTQVLETQARTRPVMLVVIGPTWKKAAYTDEDRDGVLRLSDPNDWVRKEITFALDAGNTVIPVLLDDVVMPSETWLANLGLKRLHDQQAMHLSINHYKNDLAKLVQRLREVCPGLPAHTGRDQGPNAQPRMSKTNPQAYLDALKNKTGFIDIRGLPVTREGPRRFPIEELYISLTTTHIPKGPGDTRGGHGRRPGAPTAADKEGMGESRTVPLQDALQHERLIVVGDPGAGKTTFLQRVAHTLCQNELGEVLQAAEQRLGIKDRTFPIFIRISNLAQHLLRPKHKVLAPDGDDVPGWLPHYLAAAGAGHPWGLPAAFFRAQLEEGRATVLLDGLDEAPDRVVRERVSRLIENASQAYGRCRFVVSSRPAAYTGEVLLPEFAHAQIDPLCNSAVETFLRRWCESLYAESPAAADGHYQQLLRELRAKPAIRRMARTPVMLTALAVLHWNEHTLPEQRAELYESVIRWLSRAHEDKPEREKAERTVELLRELALAMQDHPDGLKLQVSKRWAAERLAPEWADGRGVDHKALDRAEAFLDAEELDSGIIVGRGSEVQFWHRTFQEFLAARAIAARPEPAQEALLWGPPARLYLPEWREVMLLLAGILHKQGREKVDNLFQAVLNRLGPGAGLAEEARTAGLLGGMVQDLAPFAYAPRGTRYVELLGRVRAIFDRAGSASVPLETRIAAADALGQAGDSRLDHHQDAYWVTIPAGKFLMGAQTKPTLPNFDEEASKDEGPVHEVYLDEYRLGRYPVTVGQYQQFVEDEGYQDPRWWQAGRFGEFRHPEDLHPEVWDQQLPYPARPVAGVSWKEAMAFSAWARLRLPTEAEWERAARGTEGRKFPWGNEPAEGSRLNFAVAGKPTVGHPTPVGIYPLGNTPEGLSDMAGNVWERCTDLYYPGKKVDRRVLRGGSWINNAWVCRAASRYRYASGYRYSYVGFRVASSAAPRTS